MVDFSNAPIHGRVEGIKKALEMLNEVKDKDVFIIETGTTRGDLGGGPESDGWATPLFGWYCQQKGGTVWTVDIEEEAIEQCKKITKDFSEHIQYFVGDSSKILAKSDRHIDLLYLDSANDPVIALNELKACEKNISEKTIVYIDDTSLNKKRPGGVCKGVLVYQYLYEKGWDLVFDNGDQVIMTKSPTNSRPFLGKWLNSFKAQRIYKRVLRKGAL